VPVGNVFSKSSIVLTSMVAFAYWALLLTALLLGYPVVSILLTGASLPLLGGFGLTIWKAASQPLSGLAYLDDLTGLPNRRAFTPRAMSLVGSARPGAASLVLLDVDGLKTVNDACGHQAGDELLQVIARHLSGFSDAVFRVGGDEFAVLVDRDGGDSVTGLMKMLVPLEHRFQTCGHLHAIHLSYGFASRREDEGFEQIFSRADARLRQFKQQAHAAAVQAAGSADLDAPQEPGQGESEGGTVVSIFSRSARPPEEHGGMRGAGS